MKKGGADAEDPTCARKGHAPQAIRPSPLLAGTKLAFCKRCRKWYEMPPKPANEKTAG